MEKNYWLTIAGTLAFFLLINLHSWDPGIGLRKDGSELDLYYGWPSCYRAEWWRSNDPEHAKRVLQTAPFYIQSGEMQLVSRSFGWQASFVNVLFAGLFLGLLTIAFNRSKSNWTLPWVATAGIMLAVLVTLYLIADRVAVYL